MIFVQIPHMTTMLTITGFVLSYISSQFPIEPRHDIPQTLSHSFLINWISSTEVNGKDAHGMEKFYAKLYVTGS
jgi:hypothetical protein